MTTRRPYRADLIGMKFGTLTVVGPGSRHSKNGKFWACQCDCGRTKEVTAYRLQAGVTKTCGKHSRPDRVVDISGQRFGRLVALKLHGRNAFGRATWECLCDCGTIKILGSNHLRNGKIVSCGCFAKEMAPIKGGKGGHKLRGANCHLFKPELSDEHRVATRNLVEYREWKKAVLARDEHTCQLCGQKKVGITTHHLESWASAPSLRFVLSNGITLCRKHHKEFHTYMGGERFPCTAKDFADFRARYLDRMIDRLEKTA